MTPSPSDRDAILEQLRPVLEATAKNLLHHLADQPAALAQGTFDELESLHGLLLEALAVHVLGLALQRQADLWSDRQPNCPHCAGPLQVRPPLPCQVETVYSPVT